MRVTLPRGLVPALLFTTAVSSIFAQSRAITIAGVRPGISTHAEVDLTFGESRNRLDNQTFEYAPPASMPGIRTVVVTYFSDTTQVARLEAWLSTPAAPDAAHADDTLGALTLTHDRANGEREEIFATSLRGFILATTPEGPRVTALVYFSTRALVDLYSARFHEYMAAKQYADARVEADKAIALDPEYARGWLNAGDYFSSQKNDEEALARYIAAAAAKYTPGQVVNGHLALITAYGLKKQWIDKAETEFRAALAGAVTSAQRVTAHDRWAEVLAHAARNADAVKEYGAALAINRNDADAHLGLGDADYGKKNWPGAAGHYDALVALLKAGGTIDSSLLARRADVYFRDAFCQSTLGHDDAAIALYRTSIELDPKVANAHNNLGYLYVKAGRFDDAMAEYRAGLQLNAKDTMMLNNYAYALVRTGAYDEALKQVGRAIDLKAGDGKAMVNMARAFAGLGKTREALDWLGMAVAAGYHDSDAITDPVFDKLRKDGDFKKLADRLK